MSDVVIYEDGSVAINARVEHETLWLNRKQIAELFDVNVPAISKHVKNIYSSEELSNESTVSKMETFQKEQEFFNLDMIIAVVATSAPEQKEIIIKLVMNMLYEGRNDG